MVTFDTPSLSQPKSISRIKPEKIREAVQSLLNWKKSKANSQKPQLLPQDDFLYLILTLKKIPPNKGRTNPYKIPIPHPLYQDSLSSEVCLIIDDRPKSHLTSEETKKKIKAGNIAVSKVLKFSKLKTDYKAFEAKRKLCDSYDLFFADKTVIPLLPKLLGKQFFKKKKLPLSVNLGHKNWREQIERGCSSTFLYMKAVGTCRVVRVGRLAMETEEIVENVVEAINGVVEFVEKKWEGVRSLHLKFTESLALPVYQTVPDMKLKIKGISETVEDVEEGGSEVVWKEERKKVVKVDKKGKKKGRIHEVRYMDASVDEDELGRDTDGDENKSEDDDLGSDEFVEKNRKKGGSAKKRSLLDLNAEKPGKKTHKVGKARRVKFDDGNVGEISEDDDLGSGEFQVKKKKVDSPKGRVTSNKKAKGEELKNAHLASKDIEESGGKKGKRKDDLGTTVKNSVDKKVKKSKKKQSAE